MTQEQKNVSIPGVTVNTSISTFPAPVGIGASDPQSVLHIVSQSPVVKVEDTATAPAAVPRINFMDSTGLLGEVGYSGSADSALYITNAKPDAVHILTNSVKRMTVLGTGNIGIGTVTPSVALEVVGGLSAARMFTASLTATTFTVTGVSTLGGVTASAVSVTGGLSAGSIFTPSLTATTLNVTGLSNLGGVTAAAMSITGGLSAGTVFTASLTASTLNVTGLSNLGGVTAAAMSITGGLSAGTIFTPSLTATTLNVTGVSTLGGVTAAAMSITGGLSAGTIFTPSLTATTLNVTGVSTLGGVTAAALSVTGGLSAGTIFTPSLTATTMTVTGVSTLAGVTASNLYVSGGLTAAASLSVVGVSTLAGVTAQSLFVKNGLTAAGSLGVVGNITIAGSLANLQSAAAMSTISNMSFISNGDHPTYNRIVVGTDGTGYKFAISTMTASSSIIDRLTINTANGYVGIGITTPAYALDVTGTIQASANLIVQGNVNVGGVTTLVGVTADSMFVKGGITAGTVSATTFNGALNGNANTATTVTTIPTLSGDVTSSGNTIAIAAGVIMDADINSGANIADSKLNTISMGGKVSNSATTATPAATANAIVARDPSGGFLAAGITATSINVSSYQLASGGFSNQTGTAYTILATDNGKIVTGSSTSAITFTLPAAAIGFSVTIIQSNTGSITIKPNGTDTLNSFGKTPTTGLTTGLTTGGQWAAVDVVCTESTKWALFGNLA